MDKAVKGNCAKNGTEILTMWYGNPRHRKRMSLVQQITSTKQRLKRQLAPGRLNEELQDQINHVQPAIEVYRA